MPDTADARARLADAIAADYAMLARNFIAACPAPARHRWAADPRQQLFWYRGDVVGSTCHGASIILRAEPAVEGDERFHAELRWFRKAEREEPRRRQSRHEAILWCEHGPRRGGFRNLLDASENFPKADTVEDLAAIAAATFRRILWP